MAWKDPKPLWGFGWAGRCLLVPALLLAVIYFSGYDARHRLLQWVNDHFGYNGVLWVVLGPLMHHFFAIHDPGFSWWSLTYILIALHLHPRRTRWLALPAVGWALVRPYFYFQAIRRPGQVLSSMVAASMGTLDPSSAVIALYGAIDIVVLAALTRSRLVFFVAAGASAAAIVAYRVLNALGPVVPVWCWISVTVVYHVAVGGSMIWWAARARSQFLRPGRCKACGYDLQGLAGATCPECGGVDPAAVPA